MKQSLLLFIAATAISSLAQATLVSCTVNPQGPLVGETTPLAPFTNTAFTVNNGVSGGTITNAITCPTLDAGAGNIISSYQVIASADYALGSTDGNQVALTYFTSAAAPIGATSFTATVSGGISSGPSNPVTPFTLGSLTPGTQTVNGFNLDVSSIVLFGEVAVSSGQVAIQYTSAPSTPEPQSMALSGLSLLGLALLARPRKRK
jgi:hypothetical protein